MKNLQEWISQHKYELYVLSFLLMLLPPAALYSAARGGSDAWIWTLLFLVGLGNILAIAVP